MKNSCVYLFDALEEYEKAPLRFPLLVDECPRGYCFQVVRIHSCELVCWLSIQYLAMQPGFLSSLSFQISLFGLLQGPQRRIRQSIWFILHLNGEDCDPDPNSGRRQIDGCTLGISNCIVPGAIGSEAFH